MVHIFVYAPWYLSVAVQVNTGKTEWHFIDTLAIQQQEKVWWQIFNRALGTNLNWNVHFYKKTASLKRVGCIFSKQSELDLGGDRKFMGFCLVWEFLPETMWQWAVMWNVGFIQTFDYINLKDSFSHGDVWIYEAFFCVLVNMLISSVRLLIEKCIQKTAHDYEKKIDLCKFVC